MFRSFAAGKSLLVEYGCGGSTLMGVELAESVISVESDPSWIERLSAHPAIVAALTDGRLKLLHADIGPVGGFGKPLDESTAHRWPGYWMRPWPTTSTAQHAWQRLYRPARPQHSAPRLILVDGRFRVACTLFSALQMRAGDVLLIHDFWNRPAYHVVLDHLSPIARADTLVALVPRADAKPGKMREVVAAHARQPA